MSVQATWVMALLVVLVSGTHTLADAPKTLNPDSAASSSKELEEAIRSLSRRQKGIRSLYAECEMEEWILPTSWLPVAPKGEPESRRHQFAIRWMEERWWYRWTMQFSVMREDSRILVTRQDAACNGTTFESLTTYYQWGDTQANVMSFPGELKKPFWQSWEVTGFGLTGRTHRWHEESGPRFLMRFLSVLDPENFERGLSSSVFGGEWFPLNVLERNREKGLTVVPDTLQGKPMLLVKGTQDLGAEVQEFRIWLNPERDYLPSRWVRVAKDTVLKDKVFHEETFSVSEWANVEGLSFPVRMEDVIVEIKQDGTRTKRREIKTAIHPQTLRVNQDLNKESYHVSFPVGTQVHLPVVNRNGDRSNRITIIGIPWEFTDRNTHNLLIWTLDFVTTGKFSWMSQQLRWLVMESVVLAAIVMGCVWWVMRWRKRRLARQKNGKFTGPEQGTTAASVSD